MLLSSSQATVNPFHTDECPQAIFPTAAATNKLSIAASMIQGPEPQVISSAAYKLSKWVYQYNDLLTILRGVSTWFIVRDQRQDFTKKNLNCHYYYREIAHSSIAGTHKSRISEEDIQPFRVSLLTYYFLFRTLPFYIRTYPSYILLIRLRRPHLIPVTTLYPH